MHRTCRSPVDSHRRYFRPCPRGTGRAIVKYMAGGHSIIVTEARAHGRRVTTPAAFTLVTTSVVAVLATYAFSRLTGWLSDSFVMPVGAATFACAVVLCAWHPAGARWAPERPGSTWSSSA